MVVRELGPELVVAHDELVDAQHAVELAVAHDAAAAVVVVVVPFGLVAHAELAALGAIFAVEVVSVVVADVVAVVEPAVVAADDVVVVVVEPVVSDVADVAAAADVGSEQQLQKQPHHHYSVDSARTMRACVPLRLGVHSMADAVDVAATATATVHSLSQSTIAKQSLSWPWYSFWILP